MKLTLTLLVAWLPASIVSAQSYLDLYLRQALTGNEAIRQQQIITERHGLAAAEARRLYLPEVNLNASYTRARGGRTIDLPLGDLLNPVYGALNGLTQSKAFPRLDNQRVLLNPDDFYDVHARTTLPLLNVEIGYNRQIKQHQAALADLQLTQEKRELAKDLKVAYYRYLQASEAVRIYQNSLNLVMESQRINQSLFNNDKVNRTTLVRSTNEVTRMQANLTVARLTQASAAAYVNFLLNRPAEAPLGIDSITDAPPPPTEADTNLNAREELARLGRARDINRALIGMAGAYRVPKISFFGDVGLQAFHFNVDRQAPYYLMGASLSLPLFTAGRNGLNVRQAVLEGQALEANTRYTKSQLGLQVTTARLALKGALAQYGAAQSQATSSSQNYQDIKRLYTQGQALYIELLDAQNQAITDQLQVSISRFDAWARQAELERATATLTIN